MKKNRILAWLLVLCMAMTMLPAAALADDADSAGAETESETTEESTEDAGEDADPDVSTDADDSAEEGEDASAEEDEDGTDADSEEADEADALPEEDSAEETEEEAAAEEETAAAAEESETTLYEGYSWTSDDAEADDDVFETETDDDGNTTITITGSGELALTDDLNADIVINGDEDGEIEVTIDLAGHTLTGTGTSSVITVENGASLTIEDSEAGEAEKISESEAKEIEDAWYEDDNGESVFVGTTVQDTDENGEPTGTWTTYYAKVDAELVTTTDEDGETAYSLNETYTYYAYTSGAITGGTGTQIGTTTSISSMARQYGGGIYVSDGSLTITDGTITGNQLCGYQGNYSTTNYLHSYGGGIYVDGDFTMTGGVVSNNWCGNGSTSTWRPSRYGGGIYVTGGSLYMKDSVVLANTLGKYTNSDNKNYYAQGAGIYASVDEDGFTLENCVISGNVIHGITTAQSLYDLLRSNNITGNTGATNGGGVYVKSSEAATIKIDSCDICSNYATWGGGIYVNGSEVKLTVSESDIFNNNKWDSGEYSRGSSNGGAGGGVHINSCSTATFSDSNIFDNECAGSCGGGVMMYSGTLSMTDCVIVENRTAANGGAVGLYGSSITASAKDCYFLNNIADGRGGGLTAAQGAVLTLTNCTVSGNTAGESGGGVAAHYGSFTMNGGTIENNTTNEKTYGGGGIFVDYSASYSSGGTVTITGGTISGNTATSGSGAGIYVLSGTLTISGGSITDHTATNGAGIYAASGTVTMTGGTITGNKATDTAGGVYMAGGSLTVSGGVLASNTAGTAAADIYAASGVTLSLSDPDTVNASTIFAADGLNAKIDGWYYDQANTDTATNRYDGKTNITTKYTSTASLPLYLIAAHGNVYTITYNSNYPSGTDNKTLTESFAVSGTTATGTTKGSDTFEYSGYTFTGWNTEPDGSGTSYNADAAITLTESITLYAQWEEAVEETETYTITYDPNCSRYSGTTEDTNEYEAGSTATVLKNGFKRTGYRFRYWVDADGNKYYAGDTIEVNSDITLYAVWAEIVYDYDDDDDDDDDEDEDDEEDEEEEDEVPELLNGDDHYAYIIGYPDGSVQPTGNLTRAEAATIMFRLLTDEARETYLTTENDFPDVNEGDWYNTMVSTLASIGILNGRTDGNFDPDAYITRAELAAICARFDDTTVDGIQIFTDTAGHWAEEEIGIAAALGWVEGDGDGTFRPDDYITRAETMTLINRVLDREVEDEDDLLAGMNEWFDNQPGTWYYLAVQEATSSHVYEKKTSEYEYWTEILEDPDWTIYQ